MIPNNPFFLKELRDRVDPSSPVNKLLASYVADIKPPTKQEKIAMRLREMKRRIENAKAALRGEWGVDE